MKKIFIVIVLLFGITFLFSGTIIGSWKIDQDKTKEKNIQHNPKKLAKKMAFFEKFDIYDDHTFICQKADFSAQWYKEADHYIVIYNGKQTPLYMINDENIKFIVPTFDGLKTTLYYRRVLSKKMVF